MKFLWIVGLVFSISPLIYGQQNAGKNSFELGLMSNHNYGILGINPDMPVHFQYRYSFLPEHNLGFLIGSRVHDPVPPFQMTDEDEDPEENMEKEKELKRIKGIGNFYALNYGYSLGERVNLLWLVDVFAGWLEIKLRHEVHPSGNQVDTQFYRSSKTERGFYYGSALHLSTLRKSRWNFSFGGGIEGFSSQQSEMTIDETDPSWAVSNLEQTEAKLANFFFLRIGVLFSW